MKPGRYGPFPCSPIARRPKKVEQGSCCAVGESQCRVLQRDEKLPRLGLHWHTRSRRPDLVGKRQRNRERVEHGGMVQSVELI
jgi:hypothetical protein